MTVTTGTLAKLTISQVCRTVPGARGADRICPSTVTRWILRGCPARDGTRVRLAATRCGSRWLVDADALEAFFAALSAGHAGTPPVQQPATTRRRTCARAVNELERRGA